MDESLREILEMLSGNRKSNQLKQLKSEYVIQNPRLFRKDKLKFIVPKAVRWRIVRLCYDKMGHFVLEKTISRIKQKIWFPRIC